MLKDAVCSCFCHKEKPSVLLITFRCSRSFVVQGWQGSSILQYSNTEPHTVCLLIESIQKNGWEVSPHLPYCPGLNLYNIHLFWFVEDQVWGQQSASKMAVEAVCHFPHIVEMEFYCKGIVTILKLTKMHHSGWWFCREVHTVHGCNWHGVFIFIPLLHFEINSLMT